LKTKILILIFIAFNVFSFPELMKNAQSFKKINLKINVVNGTENLAITAPLYASLSAITDNFIIKSFKPVSTNSPLVFNNIKIYPSAQFYELAISYKGVNYFKKFKSSEVAELNKIKFKVYEQGNIKDNIEVERFDYIIEVDEKNKTIRLTEDLIINNKGNFTYSPLLPQKEAGIKIPIADNINKINPLFNISENNYTILNKYMQLKVFLRPGKNYFTFNYFLRPEEFPYVIRFKTKNKVKETRVIVPDARNKIVSNLISKFSIRETKEGAIKIGIKKDIKSNQDLKFKIMGKPNFKKGIISSTRRSFINIKRFDHILGYGGLIFLLFIIFYILIFIKPSKVS